MSEGRRFWKSFCSIFLATGALLLTLERVSVFDRLEDGWGFVRLDNNWGFGLVLLVYTVTAAVAEGINQRLIARKERRRSP